MAADLIVVDKTKQLGSSFVQLADQIRQVRELCDKLSDAKDHAFAAADFSVMEVRFGLVTGVGANAATLLGLVQTIFNTNTDVTGANRLAQLDEFCARLAGQ